MSLAHALHCADDCPDEVFDATILSTFAAYETPCADCTMAYEASTGTAPWVDNSDEESTQMDDKLIPFPTLAEWEELFKEEMSEDLSPLELTIYADSDWVTDKKIVQFVVVLPEGRRVVVGHSEPAGVRLSRTQWRTTVLLPMMTLLRQRLDEESA